ncbi:hypothetical protein K3495_g2234 [Podosphaera aphanis]|nr:hypothetical protein K3495_g2234 [Podosphaera aphanis]
MENPDEKSKSKCSMIDSTIETSVNGELRPTKNSSEKAKPSQSSLGITSDPVGSSHKNPVIPTTSSKLSSPPPSSVTKKLSDQVRQTKISSKITKPGLDSGLEKSSDLNDINQSNSAAAAGLSESSENSSEEIKKVHTSPKKKRSRDQGDGSSSSDSGDESEKPGSTEGSVGHDDRKARSEPEKKRPRDVSTGQFKSSENPTNSSHKTPCCSTSSDRSEKTCETSVDVPKAEASPEKSQTSKSAFLNSGFASLAASTTSPFGNLATTKPSIFRSGAATENKSVSEPKLSTSSPSLTTTNGALVNNSGTGFNFGNGSLSGFASLGGGNIFGSKSCASFSNNSGLKLSSFAGPTAECKPLTSKPARAFGAPENGEEDKSEVDSNQGGEDTEDDENDQVGSDDRKKIKMTKVQIDDGEAEEATLLQIRAKLFALESKETGWKERGVGMLKINVPKCCVSYDKNNLPILGSYHASKPSEEEKPSKASRVARLIMRQENTHRVVLNTIILPQMQVEDKIGVSSAQLVFTAFEGEKELKPIKMLLKMSENNAKLFKSEMESIKREL